MDDSAWARFRRHRRLPQATLVLLAAALIAGFVLVRAERRTSHDTDVLARACGGVLPRDAVRGLLPEDEWWDERSGPGPRGLVSCGVGADEGRLEVTAVPVLEAPLKGVRIEHVTGDPYEHAPRWDGDYRLADATTTVACPGGLPGYPRPVTGFRVYGSLSGDATDDLPREAVAPAVAAVANGLRADHHCGGAPVRAADVKPFRDAGSEEDGKDTRAACGWFSPASLGPGWKPTGQADDGAAHTGARGCETGGLKGARSIGVTSASWWGELLPEVRTEYGHELATAGRSTPPPGTGRRSYTVAAWAEARCADGPALHRVSVTAQERDGLADRADTLLGRYLEAAHCRDTKSLGTVWQ
ncbi:MULTISPECIES: hypothetical protein [unclassified Streptomyces]|uniref:hypothetical protein n=1 Tax=unclassified Streptomyces TaxID=2593676 RepID=UPI002E361D28|nr:hypothetical protein [Streptomyces sp. NBC_01268]